MSGAVKSLRLGKLTLLLRIKNVQTAELAS
jgi:hypothetical protein